MLKEHTQKHKENQTNSIFLNYKHKETLTNFSLLSPWIFTFLIFWLYPLLYSFYLSFNEYNILNRENTFVGFENYTSLFQDEIFIASIKNTLIFSIGTVPLITIFSILLAVVVDSKLTKFQNFFRATYFLPSVTSLVVLSLIFTNIYSKNGYLSNLLTMVGISSPENGYLLDMTTALPAIMAMDIWISLGYYMVIFLAGLQTINREYYEYAEIMGLSKVEQFFKITLPLLKPTIGFVVIINTIKSFQIFIEIYIMTKGGPLNSTTTLVYMIFNNAFDKVNNMGYASAAAYILFILIIIISLIQNYLLKEKN